MLNFREWLKEKELNEMSPVKMMGNAPFESLGNLSKSKNSLEEDYIKITELNEYDVVYKHKKLELIIVVREFFEELRQETRYAIIAEMSFKIDKIKSTNKLINNKEAVILKTINVREANRRQNIASKLYLLLSEYYIVISDSVQYEGAVKLWKSFIRIPNIVLYIWDEQEDKIISKMTSKTHDNAIWSNGDLKDYSKMKVRLILINADSKNNSNKDN